MTVPMLMQGAGHTCATVEGQQSSFPFRACGGPESLDSDMSYALDAKTPSLPIESETESQEPAAKRPRTQRTVSDGVTALAPCAPPINPPYQTFLDMKKRHT